MDRSDVFSEFYHVEPSSKHVHVEFFWQVPLSKLGDLALRNNKTEKQ